MQSHIDIVIIPISKPLKIGLYKEGELFETIESEEMMSEFLPSFFDEILDKYKIDRVILNEDEMEAIRLSDFEGLYQEECSNKIGISRTTFSRLIESARKKIADALLHKKALGIEPSEKL